jgi:signal transduction histidine kinase
VEWLIAVTRVVLAGGALLAVAVDPLEPVRSSFLFYLLCWYLAYSLGMLALVWAPARFARGWDIAVHLFDFAAFSILTIATRGTSSPFFAYFLFLLVCGTLRWQLRGTLWTAVSTMAAYAGITYYGTYVLHRPGFELHTFIIRCVYLTVITILLAYLGRHQHRFQSEIGRLAAWPRRISRDSRDVVAEVLSQASALLNAKTVVLAWEEPGQGGINLAWRRDGHMNWIRESESACVPLVLPSLEGRSFQAADAIRERGRVVALAPRGFRRRDCRPINEELRARFEMRAVQSWPLDGELIRGRMFCLHRSRMRIDDLVVGELVAQLVLSRLEGLNMLGRLSEAAALEERVRVARDLHDSLLQSQAGAALQLLAARRLLDRDPDAARGWLQDVQHQLERGELEMRSFIGDLRPVKPASGEPSEPDLASRLVELRQRVERQWEIKVNLRYKGNVEHVPCALRDDVYRLIQEAVANAGRHAGASTITVVLSITDTELRLEVVDDGRGFPFHGTYDLARLNQMNQGPLTLKERVAQLAGDLKLQSLSTGTALHMRLPLTHGSN